MKKVLFLSESDALKAKIIIESSYLDLFKKYDITCLFYGSDGKAKQAAEELGYKTCVVDKDLSEFDILEYVEQYDDFVVVLLGWPYILGADVILALDGKIINCHGSYLPDYKGSRAYMHYWANMEDEYGVTIHFVSEQVDEGNILSQRKLKLFKEETPEIIHCRMSEVLGFLLSDAVSKCFDGDTGVKQTKGGRYFKRQNWEYFNKVRIHNENTNGEKLTTEYIIR